MRRALTPRSLRPTREAERTSMRLPFGAGLTRTTMSSVKPNQRVVSLASSRPSAGAARDDAPAHGAGRGFDAGERPIGRQRQGRAAPGRDSRASAGRRRRRRHRPRRSPTSRAAPGARRRAAGCSVSVVMSWMTGHRGRRAHHDQQRRRGREGDEQRQSRACDAAPGAGGESERDAPRGENGGHEAPEPRQREDAERPARAQEAQAMARARERDAQCREDCEGERRDGEARGPPRPPLPPLSASLRHGRDPPRPWARAYRGLTVCGGRG